MGLSGVGSGDHGCIREGPLEEVMRGQRRRKGQGRRGLAYVVLGERGGVMGSGWVTKAKTV